MIKVCAGDGTPEPHDPDWQRHMYLRLSHWIIDNPNWAEVCFVSQGVSESQSWSNPVAALLLGGLPSDADLVDNERDSALLAHVANDYGAAMLKTILAVGDVDYGAEVIRATFTSVRTCIGELARLRSRQARPTLTLK